MADDRIRPSIDHSLLSNSGHMSNRARLAAEERERAKLFPPGFWDKPEPTEDEKRDQERTAELRHAKTLRELADRGMKPRKYRKEADAIEKKWGIR